MLHYLKIFREKKISKNKLKLFTHKLLKHPQRDAIVADIYELLVNSSNSNQVLSIIGEGLSLLSKAESNKSLDIIVNFASYILDHYQQFSNVIKNIETSKWKVILKYAENLISHFNTENFNIDNVIDWLIEDEFKIKQIIDDPKFYLHGHKIADAINKINENSVYDLFDLVRKITSDSTFTLGSINNLINKDHNQRYTPRYITNLLRFMFIQDEYHSKLYWGLLELFDENEVQLRNFLSDIFLKIHLIGP